MLRSQNVPYIWKKIEFLGHKVSEDSASVQTGKIDAVRDWPVPTSISEL